VRKRFLLTRERLNSVNPEIWFPGEGGISYLARSQTVDNTHHNTATIREIYESSETRAKKNVKCTFLNNISLTSVCVF